MVGGWWCGFAALSATRTAGTPDGRDLWALRPEAILLMSRTCRSPAGPFRRTPADGSRALPAVELLVQQLPADALLRRIDSKPGVVTPRSRSRDNYLLKVGTCRRLAGLRQVRIVASRAFFPFAFVRSRESPVDGFAPTGPSTLTHEAPTHEAPFVVQSRRGLHSSGQHRQSYCDGCCFCLTRPSTATAEPARRVMRILKYDADWRDRHAAIEPCRSWPRMALDQENRSCSAPLPGRSRRTETDLLC